MSNISTAPKSNIYTVGGTVQAGSGIYIPRKADDDLFELCRTGEFAFVLSTRQVGKSSLMVHTAQRLAQEDIRSAIIDLSGFGASPTEEQWYLGLIVEMADQLTLEADVIKWWREQTHLGTTQRLTAFFQKVLLSEIKERKQRIVIFVDEIDTTLNLPFSDDFFAAIRSVYNARAHEPELKRLSFVLIGVATPIDLIRDSKRTPFNIGSRVELADFTFEDAKPLAEGLGLPQGENEEALKQILNRTGGHPYLTQRLCKAVADWKKDGKLDGSFSEADLQSIVEDTFLKKSEQDPNLLFVRDMLTKRVPAGNQAAVLKTYRKVLDQDHSVPDEEQSIIKSHLKLSGVVRREGSMLKPRNPIYKEVFNERWVSEHLPADQKRRIKYLYASIAALVLVTVGITAWQQNIANQQLLDSFEEQGRLSLLAGDPSRASVYLSKAYEEGRDSPQLRFLLTRAMRPLDGKLTSFDLSLDGHTDSVNSAAFSPAVVYSAAFSPDGKRIVTASGDNTAKVWDADSGNLLYPLDGHKGLVASAAFSPDGKRIVTASGDNTAKVWDADSGKCLYSLEGPTFVVRSAAFSPPDGKRIVTASGSMILLTTEKSGDNTAKVWDADSGNLLYPLDGHKGLVASAAFSPDGKRIVTASRDNTAKVWDTDSGKLLYSLEGHKDSVRSAAFSPPDGKRIVTASLDNTAKVWDADSGKLLYPLDGHKSLVASAAFSPDGKRIVTASLDNTAKVWDADSGKLLYSLEGHTGSLNSAAFSPDGKRIVTASLDNTAKVWDVDSGKLLYSLEGHTGSLNSAAFSPDGNRIVTASFDNTAKVWDVHLETRSPKEIAEIVKQKAPYRIEGDRLISR